MTPRGDVDMVERDWLEFEKAMQLLSIEKDVKNTPEQQEQQHPGNQTDVASISSKSSLPDICPLCSNVVQYFKMNYMEMVKMCSNMECVYPFAEETLDIKPFSQYSDSSGLSPGCSTQTSISSDQRSKADSGLGYGEADFEKEKETFVENTTISDVKETQVVSKRRKIVVKPPLQNNMEKEEQNKIDKLLEHSSNLVMKLNKYQKKARSTNLKNPLYIKRLLSIEKSMNVKNSVVNAREMAILEKCSNRNNKFNLDIQLPHKQDDIPKIDVTFG